MIREEICTYEVAKLAKEKGFPQWFNYARFKFKWDYYNHKGELNGDLGDILKLRVKHKPISEEMKPIAAPTQSLLQRWLRENGFGEVEVRHWSETDRYPHHYGWEVKDNLGDLMGYSSKMFDTYELALEDALKYTLENLI